MMHSGNVLAFVGDAVLSLQVREYLVSKGITQTKKLQETSVKFVSAKAQANFVNYFLDQNILKEDEIQIFKRGRNAKSQTMAKNADMITYRLSTGFEALWGYLYLSDKTDRLEELWKIVKDRVDLYE